MIQGIEISDVATFITKQDIYELKTINYFFGANAAGKTTISKGIAANGPSRHFTLFWEANLSLERVVFNRDFVEGNFSQAEELKGIFTLGEDEINLAAQIEAQRQACDDLREDIAKLVRNRDGDPADSTMISPKQKQEELDAAFREACWEIKAKFDNDFREVLRGNLRKERFRDRALQECLNNKCSAADAKTLVERIGIAYGLTQERLPEIPRPSFSRILGFEQAPILTKKVIGKTDVDVAGLIEKLGNSDWVRQGATFLDRSEGKCPFCQEDVPGTLRERFDAYFDETYLQDTNAIRALKTNYLTEAITLQRQLAEIERNGAHRLDAAAFQKECTVLDLTLKGNIEKLHKKQDESSRVIVLESIASVSQSILQLIDSANDAISKHNTIIDDLGAQRAMLEAEVWRHLLDSGLKKLVEEYEKAKSAIRKAVEGLSSKIEAKMRDLERAKDALKDLEKKTTSVEPTINEINKILMSFGFQGFSLAIGASKSTYKLVRANGESAKNTLSEGEKTFVTFLYFYHLVKGSKDPTSVSASRIVVFDDPVSSLDSDVLHIVSCLIKQLFEDACEKKGLVKQIFILTHNTYFHKEVSYIANMRVSPKQVTYWMVTVHRFAINEGQV